MSTVLRIGEERAGRAWASSGALALCLAASTSCADSQAAAPQSAPPPLAVTVVRLQPHDVEWAPERLGQTAASLEVGVRSRVQGTLIERAFEEGGRVHAGDVLFRIDPRPFEAARDAARAVLAEARGHLEEADRAVARKQQLVESESIARRELEDALTDQALARALIAAAEARLQQAELDLEYATITSPLDGRVEKALYDAGSYVNSFANPLLTVVARIDPLYVSFRLSERELIETQDMLARGQLVEQGGAGGERVVIELADGTRFEHEGRINFRSVHVDPATGTAEVRAELPNPEERLLPGQFVRARVIGLVRTGVLTVPQRAVLIGASSPFVYVLDEHDQVQARDVRLSRFEGSDWIVEEGLRPGERVVVDGLQKLRPGASVTPTESEPAK